MLKTTGSAFESFVRDEYTTLVEVNDRIFSTSIDLSYKFAPLRIPAPADGEGKVFDLALTPEQAKGTAWDGDAVSAAARGITLEVFAIDESASVQVCRMRLASDLTHGHSLHLYRRRCTRWLSGLLLNTRTSRA